MRSGVFVVSVGLLVAVLLSCDGKRDQAGGDAPDEDTLQQLKSTENNDTQLITFVELGSVNCIPCVKMQPVMKNIEAKYGQQVEVIFYDVWQEDQKEKAGEYRIRLIPTQVFLDASGKEIFRHEGFFPEVEIDQLLKSHGLVPKSDG